MSEDLVQNEPDVEDAQDCQGALDTLDSQDQPGAQEGPALQLDRSGATEMLWGLAMDQKFLEFHRVRLWLAWEGSEFEAAQAAVQKLLAEVLPMEPRDGELWIHNGIGKQLTGEHQLAGQILSKTLPTCFPHREYLRGWVSYCESLIEVGDFASAEALLQDVCRKNPTMPLEYARKFLAFSKRLQSSSVKWRRQ